ncbi:MAG: hypothetical protein ACM3WV_10585 [Bacillota bacterium]
MKRLLAVVCAAGLLLAMGLQTSAALKVYAGTSISGDVEGLGISMTMATVEFSDDTMLLEGSVGFGGYDDDAADKLSLLSVKGGFPVGEGIYVTGGYLAFADIPDGTAWTYNGLTVGGKAVFDLTDQFILSGFYDYVINPTLDVEGSGSGDMDSFNSYGVKAELVLGDSFGAYAEYLAYSVDFAGFIVGTYAFTEIGVVLSF